jgi:twitching motility protein PilT
MDTSQGILIKDILTEAITRGASDLHFSVGNYPVLRVGRDLLYLENRDLINQDFMEKFVGSLLKPAQKAKLTKDKEIILSYNFDKQLRFKINIFYQRSFLSATLRYIPAKIPTLSQLGLADVYKNLTKLDSGLVIISGTFGSGRSSSAAAIINEINHARKKYILTIEDPIEYVFANNSSMIEQREVGQDTNSYSDALKYFQEEDGDVLYLEQMSNPDLIPLVLNISNGNSLVITSMTADSVTKTISSILDNFASIDQERIRDLLANSLRAVVCQKMIYKIGGQVRVICEVLLVNDTIKSVISRGNISQLENIVQTSKKDGMVSFNQSLAEAVNNGEISRDEALAHSADSRVLENLIR